MDIGKFFKWMGIGISSIFAIAVVALAALEFFVSDAYVAKAVTKVAQKSLNAELSVKEVDFTAFSHFPHIGIRLMDGSVVSKSHLKDSTEYSRTPAQADSLVCFKEFTLLFSPLKLLAGNIQIQGIIFDSPKAYAYISPTGCANWDIVAADSTTTPTEDTLTSFPLKINIRNVSIINGGHFVFDNRADGLRASAAMQQVNLSGNFTDDFSKIRVRKGDFSHLNMALFHRGERTSVRFSIDTLNVQAEGRGKLAVEAQTRTNVRIARNSMAENVPLDLQGNITLGGRREKAVTLEDFKVFLAGIPLNFNGKISYGPDSLHTEALYASIEEFPLEDVLQYVPKSIVPDIKKLHTTTRLSVDAKIYGSYNMLTGELPKADVQFNIPSSSIEFDGIKEKIREVYLNGKYHFRPNIPDSNMVAIEKMLVDGDGIVIYGKGSIEDIGDNPYMDIYLNSRVNLDSLVKMLPEETQLHGTGSMAAELSVKSRLSNLTLYNLAKADIKGSINAQKVEMGIPSRNIFCNIYGSEVKLGSNVNTKDTTIAKGLKMMGLFIKVDSTYIKYTDSLLIKGSSIRFSGRNEASLFDTTSKAVKPFKGTLAAKSFVMNGPDSTSIRIASTKNSFSILPYKGNINVPAIQLTSSNRMIMLRQDVNFISVSNGEFGLQANLNDTQTRMREQRISRLADSLQVIYPQIARDSLFGHWMMERRKSSGRNFPPDEFYQEDYNFRLTDKGILYLLNRWDAHGKLNAGRIRVASPVFPLRTRIEEPEMKFDLNTIKIEKANIRTGQSSFKVTGDLNGIKGALSRGSRLRANMNIDADTLNFNELTRALSAGEEFMAKGKGYKDSLMTAENEDSLEKAIALEGVDTLSKMSLIIIPRNIEATLNMNVKYGIYSSIVLQKASGTVTSKNRCLQIMDFNATTSAGAMDLNAFYKTLAKDNLSAGFDLEFKDMHVEEFIRLYPGMDTLLPMLKSFEGIINCQMAATTQIDTNMNIILPSIEGVARIRGDSLVLLDGETFAEIAKMLKFKNRERNLVDNIAVEVAIKDNQLEVFPFIMKMDRYTAAISGKQDLEMNFDYHISVLKSPIPMKMGINISGNMDDFKFRIGKAQYKDTNLPVYSKLIDSTRVNLLEQIKNIYKE